MFNGGNILVSLPTGGGGIDMVNGLAGPNVQLSSDGVPFAPAGRLGSTNAQAAIQEVMTFISGRILLVAGTTLTLNASHEGKILVFESATTVSITLPNQAALALAAGYSVQFRNKQAGTIVLVTSGTDTLVGAGGSTNISGKIAAVYLETAAVASVWVSVGDMM